MIAAIYRWFLLGLAGLGALACVGADSDADMPQTSEAVRVWHVDKGLPSEMVTAIIQTRDGFLWIGTSAGLARFDGVTFTEIKTPDSSTNHLTGITALCEDRNGRVWVGTQQDGLFKLEGGKVLRFGSQQGLLEGAVTSLAADDRGQVWIGGTNGLSLWTGDRFQLFTKHDGLPDDWVIAVNVAHSGTVLVTTRTGMCRYGDGRMVPFEFQTESQGRSPQYLGAYEDERGNLWAFGDTYLINLTENKRFNYFRSEPTSVRIWSLCEGRGGRLWIGTSGRGLYCFDDNRFQPVILGEQRWPYDVRAICEDSEGNLWLGTSGGGLAQLRPQAVHVVRMEQGLPATPPTAVAVNGGEKIFVSLQRGGLFVGESGRFERVNADAGLAVEGFISSLAVARDGTLWAGTWGDGLYGWRNGRTVYLTTANGLADNSILAVCVDSQGGVWASTRAGTLHRFTGGRTESFEPAPNQLVTTLLPSADHGVWLGTSDGRILREDAGKFAAVASTARNNAVLAMGEGRDNRLWVGTTGGLACFVNGAGRSWTTNDGLPDEVIAGVVEDAGTNLWLATGAGVYRVDQSDLIRAPGQLPAKIESKLIYPVKTRVDPKAMFGGPRAALAPDGYVWFVTSDGVIRVTTRQSVAESAAFPVYLESVTINGGSPQSLLRAGAWSAVEVPKAPLETPLALKSLQIDYTALSYSAPGSLQFRHKLEGFDPDWTTETTERAARYLRLPPGNYRFHVAARSPGGPWQEAGQTFAFLVPTPIYSQTWAIVLYVFVAAGLIAVIVRVISHRRLRRRLARLEQQQSLERERMRIARDMHDEMGSKLTKISFLSEHLQMGADTPGPLGSKIQSIAQASRDLLQTMDEIVWVVNPHNDTLENLVAYLSHYAVEYFQNTSIECDMRLPREVPQAPLSSEIRHNLFLTFQEALNNVLKHSDASKVQVETFIHLPAFEIRIVDNGKGFSGAAIGGQTRGSGGGAGQKNMRQRMEAIGGRCRVESNPGGGTVVTLRLELPNQPAGEA